MTEKEPSYCEPALLVSVDVSLLPLGIVLPVCAALLGSVIVMTVVWPPITLVAVVRDSPMPLALEPEEEPRPDDPLLPSVGRGMRDEAVSIVPGRDCRDSFGDAPIPAAPASPEEPVPGRGSRVPAVPAALAEPRGTRPLLAWATPVPSGATPATPATPASDELLAKVNVGVVVAAGAATPAPPRGTRLCRVVDEAEDSTTAAAGVDPMILKLPTLATAVVWATAAAEVSSARDERLVLEDTRTTPAPVSDVRATLVDDDASPCAIDVRSARLKVAVAEPEALVDDDASPCAIDVRSARLKVAVAELEALAAAW